MKSIAKTVNTPAGKFPFPMNPAFKEDLALCQTNEDLFELVEWHGFINPDAFTEVMARGLVPDYEKWKETKNSKLTKK